MIVVSCFIVCKHSCTSSFFLIKKCLLKCPVQYFLCFYCPFNLVLVIIFWFFVSNLHKKLFAFAWRFFLSGIGMSVHTAPPHYSVCSPYSGLQQKNGCRSHWYKNVCMYLILIPTYNYDSFRWRQTETLSTSFFS